MISDAIDIDRVIEDASFYLYYLFFPPARDGEIRTYYICSLLKFTIELFAKSGHNIRKEVAEDTLGTAQVLIPETRELYP